MPLDAVPDLLNGITISSPEIPREKFATLINTAWDLQPDDPRGVLYSFAPYVSGWKIYVASKGDEIAGISVFCSYESVGLLMLAVVMPSFRGFGLQSWFIAERLAEATARGCTLAISETNDDNASPRNLQRAGFEHWITREVYRRSL